MRTSSAKAKGRRASQEIKELLLKYSNGLQDEDFIVTPSGVTGPDVHLSPAAKKQFPIVIEAKNQESISIWAALEQAKSHQTSWNESPVLFFRRNRSVLYACLPAEDFVRILSDASRA